MSKTAARMIAGQLILKPNSVLGLATGSTPVGMYAELASMYKRGEADFSKAVTFNLDEYYPIARENDQSYYYFMNEHLYSKVNLNPQNVHIPDGSAKDIETECANYDKSIDEFGGIDLQILGIGNNGHIAFNEPEEELTDKTHLVKLTDDTIEANSRFFASKDDVPRNAVTSGMATILKAKKIILLVNGKGKGTALKKVLSGKITTACPATMLNLHRDVIVIADNEAME
ncbi:glucosamine-6-phosphate isomerase [Holotrichia oblita]|nr:glucosamine-6-phosphate isomerase [Holotrichia oblita]